MGLDAVKIITDLAEYRANQKIFNNDVLWLAANSMNDASIWWKGLLNTRELSVVASRILTFPPTLCSSERNWKTFSLIKTKKRNMLSTNTLTKLVYIKFNLDLCADKNKIVLGKNQPIFRKMFTIMNMMSIMMKIKVVKKFYRIRNQKVLKSMKKK